VYEKWDPTAQDADQQQVAIRIIRADFRAEFLDAGSESFFVDQYFSEYVVVILHSSHFFIE
jgi:hypothetical protein